VVIGLFLLALTALIEPANLFGFPRRAPQIWLMVVCLYPLLSAYPQELIYRAFLFHRYRPLLRSDVTLVWVSTISFGFLHLIYDNWIAVLFGLLGGYFFSTTYRRTGSLLAASLEHALYGLLVFTIGLGQYFYEGW
jgi:membrane protease YdiL (CAAX protease family)